MSAISERIMRGGYVSKVECFEHAEEIGRVMDCYGVAMDAMEAHDRVMESCICDWDANWEGTGYVRTPNAGCPVHAEEDQD